MAEQGGVRAGMTVRDGAGKAMGKVHRVYAWGFAVVKGFWQPREYVYKHEEVARVDGDVIHVTRGPDDLLRLAAGELPAGWTPQPTPFGPAVLAAPGEARAAGGQLGSPPTSPTLSRDEEREAERARGVHPAPARSGS